MTQGPGERPPAGYGPWPYDQARYDQLVQWMGTAMSALAPGGWRRVDLRVAMAGGASRAALAVVMADGSVREYQAPREFLGVAAELRSMMYRPGEGTWFGMRFMLEPPGAYRTWFDADLDPGLGGEAYRRDLAAFPRTWLPVWLGGAARSTDRALTPDEQAQLLGDLAQTLGMFLPSGWAESIARYAPDGSSVQVTGLDGRTNAFAMPPALSEMFAVLRQGATQPWAAASFRLTFPDTHQIAYESPPAPAAPVQTEPVHAEEVAPVQAEEPGRDAQDASGLRMVAAPLAADGEARPDVPEDEREALVRYLEQAPIVLAARSLDVDELDPERAARVPLTFHTDGTWVWPGAVGYYLRAHGVAPDPELVAHARGHGFRPPEVDDATRDAAVTLIRS
ncbi:hypothetical protein [Actinomadura harenae]|uniref:Uncharacterized protein n=1 Tax=Actinomadura harenae TaxID=2483351 RepID=A0A3M2LIB5_9ACTN|nr:hypothetical protein [Actinomadura harenae]RMI36866.1 hypothetical protein EBO15_37460 [Actinomadura harenae]